MTTKRAVLRPFGHRGPQGPPDARARFRPGGPPPTTTKPTDGGSPTTNDQLAIAADQVRITHNRPATDVEAGAQALPKAPGRGWSAWLANVKRRRALAREKRLEWIERQQRLERRKRESGEYVPDRWHDRYG